MRLTLNALYRAIPDKSGDSTDKAGSKSKQDTESRIACKAGNLELEPKRTVKGKLANELGRIKKLVTNNNNQKDRDYWQQKEQFRNEVLQAVRDHWGNRIGGEVLSRLKFAKNTQKPHWPGVDEIKGAMRPKHVGANVQTLVSNYIHHPNAGGLLGEVNDLRYLGEDELADFRRDFVDHLGTKPGFLEGTMTREQVGAIASRYLDAVHSKLISQRKFEHAVEVASLDSSEILEQAKKLSPSVGFDDVKDDAIVRVALDRTRAALQSGEIQLAPSSKAPDEVFVHLKREILRESVLSEIRDCKTPGASRERLSALIPGADDTAIDALLQATESRINEPGGLTHTVGIDAAFQHHLCLELLEPHAVRILQNATSTPGLDSARQLLSADKFAELVHTGISQLREGKGVTLKLDEVVANPGAVLERQIRTDLLKRALPQNLPLVPRYADHVDFATLLEGPARAAAVVLNAQSLTSSCYTEIDNAFNKRGATSKQVSEWNNRADKLNEHTRRVISRNVMALAEYDIRGKGWMYYADALEKLMPDVCAIMSNPTSEHHAILK